VHATAESGVRCLWGVRWVRDIILVAAAVGLLIVITSHPAPGDVGWLSQLSLVLALAAAACGAMSAILAGVFGRLTGEARATWLCVATALYSMIGIPAATIGATVVRGDAAVGNLRLFAHTAFVVLVVVAAFAPRLVPPWNGWRLLSVSLLLAVIVAGLGSAFPQSSLAVTTDPRSRWLLEGAWLIAGLPLVALGWSRHSEPLSWVGLGCVVVSVAHALRLGAGGPGAALGFTFCAVRLLGMLLLLAGTLQLARGALRQVHVVEAAQREELEAARLGLQRAAERDHEVRNGLAGLAGAATIYTAAPDEARALRRAVASELARLEALLRADHAEAGDQGSFPVEPVLAEQVALRRSAGMDIRLDVDPDLRAVGSPTTLAQAMSNVLTNCARHAPGSPVRVQSICPGEKVIIRVCDFGPGVPPGSERAVFGMGVRGARSSGQGLGLHITRRLLHGSGGSVRIEPRRKGFGGCTVVLELPSGDGPGRPAGGAEAVEPA
jgi:two-component system OmpR family sensor kinase